MKLVVGLILLFGQTCATAIAPASAKSPEFVGRWDVGFTFADTTRHSLRFDAEASGTGSLLLQDPRSSLAQPAEPSDARWTQAGNGVTFSGPVEFPIGNVGRDPGVLLFKGTVESANEVSGEVVFFPANQNPNDPKAAPSKTGTFKATRVR